MKARKASTVRHRRMNGYVACQFCKGERRSHSLTIGTEDHHLSEIQICQDCFDEIKLGFVELVAQE